MSNPSPPAPAPPDLEALQRLHQELRADGRQEEILPLLAPDGERRPELARLAFEVGRDLLERDRPELALVAFTLALDHCPDLPEGQCNLGIALLQLGRTDEAFMALSLALLQQPELPEAWHALAQTMGNSGELDAALEACQRAVALRPGWVEALATQAAICLKHGDWRQGWTLYEQRFLTARSAKPHLQPVGPRCSPQELAAAGELLLVAEQGLGDSL